MRTVNRIGLVLVTVAMVGALWANYGQTEQLQCWPAHTPFRAILFMW